MLMDEAEYKKLGEELAREAAAVGLGSKQLRSIYTLAKTKPLPYVEAIVKRQTARAAQGERGGPIGFDRFGPALLRVMERFTEDKQGFEKVLLYANLLVDYVKISGDRSTETRDASPVVTSSSSTDIRSRIEPIVSQECSRYGFAGLTIRNEGSTVIYEVSLPRYYGDPAEVSRTLYSKAIAECPELRERIRFWIKR